MIAAAYDTVRRGGFRRLMRRYRRIDRVHGVENMVQERDAGGPPTLRVG